MSYPCHPCIGIERMFKLHNIELMSYPCRLCIGIERMFKLHNIETTRTKNDNDITT